MDTLDLMRTFVAVADTQSFTGAGKRLGRSKALVSKHVGELEERLGVRLINRTTRSVQVTEIGRAYYERARALIAEFESLEEAIKAESGQPRGRLRITAPQTLGEMELIEMLNAFRARFPSLDVEVFLADRLVDLISEGFDLAIRVTTLQDSTLIARKLCDVRRAAAAVRLAGLSHEKRNAAHAAGSDADGLHCGQQHPLARFLALRPGRQRECRSRRTLPHGQQCDGGASGASPRPWRRFHPGVRRRARSARRPARHSFRERDDAIPRCLPRLSAPNASFGQGARIHRLHRELVHARAALDDGVTIILGMR